MELTENYDKKRGKYLFFLAGLYLTLKLTTILLIYKIVCVGTLVLSASALLMPAWFFIGDVITEVYGYQITKRLIWIVITCQFIFSLICFLASLLPSPANLPHQAVYYEMFSKLPKVALASFLAIIAGAFINSYLISRWKIYLLGKYFWMRSLGATFVGELTFTMVAYFIEFYATTISIKMIIMLIISSLSIKILINLFASIPATLLVSFLKKVEKIDHFDYNVNFNPFAIKESYEVR